jgi:two-component system sensor histidine kinase YesM
MENAIQYALEPKVDPCTIRITAAEDGSALTITVEDNGIGMEPDFLERMLQGQVRTRDKGIGLKNIEERIKLAYGDAHGIQVESSYGHGTKVSVILPLRPEGE